MESSVFWEGTCSVKSSGQGDGILLDKERYVVVVFGASCVLPNSRLKAAWTLRPSSLRPQ
jgi:hypothetical protein